MRLLYAEVFLPLATLVTVVSSAGVVYITDLPVFKGLAPCASSAVSYVVQSLTYNKCPPGVTALESCACTKDQNFAAVSSSVASNVLNYCGSTASEDVASASIVFNAYCNQDAPVTTAPPGSNAVSLYITDIAAYNDLAPCAGSGLSYVVQSLTYNKCPPGASALASCACSKNQNSLAASASINSNVENYCGTIHSEDVASAQAVFSGYCGLANGTSSFPTTSNLAGDVTYYITDLPQYSSLASCAQSAVSYPVLSQTYKDCPAAPKALVSCACVKDQNSLEISGRINSQVSNYCGNTASADVSSALEVFDFYCSAGKGLVTPTGVTASVTTTPFVGGVGGVGGAGATGTARKTSTKSTLDSSNPTGTSSSGSDTPPSSSSKKSKPPTAAIAGGVIGGLVILILAVVFILRYRRQHRTTINTSELPRAPPLEPSVAIAPGYGKAELQSDSAVYVPPASVAAKNEVRRKPVESESPGVKSQVSPMSEKSQTVVSEEPWEVYSPPPPRRAEVDGGPNANAHEVEGQRPVQELQSQNQGQRTQHEVQGSNTQPAELRANMNEGPWEMDGSRRY